MEQKISVMQRKRDLKKVRNYESVYLENERPSGQRLSEANMRTLFKACGKSGDFIIANGRLLQKRHQQQQQQLYGCIRFGAWNVGGWSNDNFDNYRFRELVVQLHDCDIFAICETFLRGNETLSIENYTWVGNIRLNINPNARRGSGGVGTFTKNEFLTKYTCVTDKSMEDTLILKFTHRIDSSVLVLFMLFATRLLHESSGCRCCFQ